MNSSFCLLLLFLLVAQCLAQECPNNCSNRGRCNKGVCTCNKGFVDEPDDPFKDCSLVFIDHYSYSWDIARSLQAVCYVIMLGICLLGIFFGGNSVGTEERATVNNVRRIVLSLLGGLALFQVVYLAWDPECYYQSCVPVINEMMRNSFIYWTLGAYICVLFHWVDLYHISLSTLKRENMLAKINSAYKGKEVTIDDVLKKVSFLKKFKIPFLIDMAIVVFLQVLISFLVGLMPERSWSAVSYVMYGIVAINWIVCSAGFLMYGRKLASLVPNKLAKKVHKLTIRLTFTSISALCAFVIAIILVTVGSNGTPNGYMGIFFASRFVMILLSAPMIGVYIRFNRKFPWLFHASSSSTNQTSSKSVDISTSVNA